MASASWHRAIPNWASVWLGLDLQIFSHVGRINKNGFSALLLVPDSGWSVIKAVTATEMANTEWMRTDGEPGQHKCKERDREVQRGDDGNWGDCQAFAI